MANLIIKPTSGGSLILQDEGGTAAHTIDASGNHTLANTTTLANATITAGTFPSKMAIGIVSAVFQNIESTTSTSFVDVPSYTLAITPTLAANKVLVMMNFSMTHESGNSYYQMYRTGGASGDGAIYVGGSSGSITASGAMDTGNGGAGMGNHTIMYLDSPAVATAVTYKLRWRNLDGTGTTRFNINNDGTTGNSVKPSAASSITLMEVVT